MTPVHKKMPLGRKTVTPGHKKMTLGAQKGAPVSLGLRLKRNYFIKQIIITTTT